MNLVTGILFINICKFWKSYVPKSLALRMTFPYKVTRFPAKPRKNLIHKVIFFLALHTEVPQPAPQHRWEPQQWHLAILKLLQQWHLAILKLLNNQGTPIMWSIVRLTMLQNLSGSQYSEALDSTLGGGQELVVSMAARRKPPAARGRWSLGSPLPLVKGMWDAA